MLHIKLKLRATRQQSRHFSGVDMRSSITAALLALSVLVASNSAFAGANDGPVSILLARRARLARARLTSNAPKFLKTSWLRIKQGSKHDSNVSAL
jgi:hypothetical protein